MFILLNQILSRSLFLDKSYLARLTARIFAVIGEHGLSRSVRFVEMRQSAEFVHRNLHSYGACRREFTGRVAVLERLLLPAIVDDGGGAERRSRRYEIRQSHQTRVRSLPHQPGRPTRGRLCLARPSVDFQPSDTYREFRRCSVLRGKFRIMSIILQVSTLFSVSYSSTACGIDLSVNR